MRLQQLHLLILCMILSSAAFAQNKQIISTPTIAFIQQPVAVSIAQKGESIALSVEAIGFNKDISYQWYQNSVNRNFGGSPIIGATSKEYETPPFTDKEIRYYYCVASYSNKKTTSDVATVAYTGLPTLYINTPEGVEITSKEVWTENTTMTLSNASKSQWNFENVSTNIRGRGNHTWELKKKPYALKLNKKQEIMGMPKHKRWVLIANYLDNSFLKNHLAFYLSQELEMDYTLRGEFVDLIFNGTYRGLYWLGEAIKVDKNRVNINDGNENMSDKQDKDFLIEIDNHFDEPVKFSSSIRNLPYMIKNDDYMIDEDAQITTGGEARLKRLQTKISELENLLYPDYTSKKNTDNCSAPDESYSDIIDVASWAKFWLINEIMQNEELKLPRSCYFTFESTNKDRFKAGPVWDFDWGALKASNSIDVNNTIYFNALFKSPTFLATLEDLWRKYSSKINIIDATEPMRNYLRIAALTDRTKWGTHYDASQSSSKGDFDNYVDFLQSIVEHKISVVDNYITNTLPQYQISETPTSITELSTTNEAIASNEELRLWTHNKVIYISSKPGQKYKITDLYGRTLKEGVTTTNCEEITLNHPYNGIIIVLSAHNSYKIMY